MRFPALGYVLTALAVVIALLYLGFATGAVAPLLGGYDPADPEGYEHVTVTVVDGESGAARGTVEAAVADTFRKRYVGLSETAALPADRGMLFVHDDVDRRTYVMRNMDFGIDIVFADANGTITVVHHAPSPDAGESDGDRQYVGEGQYVLEVNYGWTTERGVEVGDRLDVE